MSGNTRANLAQGSLDSGAGGAPPGSSAPGSMSDVSTGSGVGPGPGPGSVPSSLESLMAADGRLDRIIRRSKLRDFLSPDAKIRKRLQALQSFVGPSSEFEAAFFRDHGPLALSVVFRSIERQLEKIRLLKEVQMSTAAIQDLLVAVEILRRMCHHLGPDLRVSPQSDKIVSLLRLLLDHGNHHKIRVEGVHLLLDYMSLFLVDVPMLVELYAGLINLALFLPELAAPAPGNKTPGARPVPVSGHMPLRPLPYNPLVRADQLGGFSLDLHTMPFLVPHGDTPSAIRQHNLSVLRLLLQSLGAHAAAGPSRYSELVYFFGLLKRHYLVLFYSDAPEPLRVPQAWPCSSLAANDPARVQGIPHGPMLGVVAPGESAAIEQPPAGEGFAAAAVPADGPAMIPASPSTTFNSACLGGPLCAAPWAIQRVLLEFVLRGWVGPMRLSPADPALGPGDWASVASFERLFSESLRNRLLLLDILRQCLRLASDPVVHRLVFAVPGSPGAGGRPGPAAGHTAPAPASSVESVASVTVVATVNDTVTGSDGHFSLSTVAGPVLLRSSAPLPLHLVSGVVQLYHLWMVKTPPVFLRYDATPVDVVLDPTPGTPAGASRRGSAGAGLARASSSEQPTPGHAASDGTTLGMSHPGDGPAAGQEDDEDVGSSSDEDLSIVDIDSIPDSIKTEPLKGGLSPDAGGAAGAAAGRPASPALSSLVAAATAAAAVSDSRPGGMPRSADPERAVTAAVNAYYRTLLRDLTLLFDSLSPLAPASAGLLPSGLLQPSNEGPAWLITSDQRHLEHLESGSPGEAVFIPVHLHSPSEPDQKLLFNLYSRVLQIIRVISIQGGPGSLSEACLSAGLPGSTPLHGAGQSKLERRTWYTIIECLLAIGPRILASPSQVSAARSQPQPPSQAAPRSPSSHPAGPLPGAPGPHSASAAPPLSKQVDATPTGSLSSIASAGSGAATSGQGSSMASLDSSTMSTGGTLTGTRSRISRLTKTKSFQSIASLVEGGSAGPAGASAITQPTSARSEEPARSRSASTSSTAERLAAPAPAPAPALEETLFSRPTTALRIDPPRSVLLTDLSLAHNLAREYLLTLFSVLVRSLVTSRSLWRRCSRLLASYPRPESVELWSRTVSSITRLLSRVVFHVDLPSLSAPPQPPGSARRRPTDATTDSTSISRSAISLQSSTSSSSSISSGITSPAMTAGTTGYLASTIQASRHSVGDIATAVLVERSASKDLVISPMITVHVNGAPFAARPGPQYSAAELLSDPAVHVPDSSISPELPAYFELENVDQALGVRLDAYTQCVDEYRRFVYFKWRSVLFLLGNVSKITVPHVLSKAIEAVVQFMDDLIKIRDIGIKAPLSDHPVPPIYLFTRWLIETANLDKKFASARALAVGGLIRLMCRWNDSASELETPVPQTPLGIERLPAPAHIPPPAAPFLPEFYVLLSRALTGQQEAGPGWGAGQPLPTAGEALAPEFDMNLLYSIIRNMPRFFATCLPGSELLIPAVLRAVRYILLGTNQTPPQEVQTCAIQVLASIVGTIRQFEPAPGLPADEQIVVGLLPCGFVRPDATGYTFSQLQAILRRLLLDLMEHFSSLTQLDPSSGATPGTPSPLTALPSGGRQPLSSEAHASLVSCFGLYLFEELMSPSPDFDMVLSGLDVLLKYTRFIDPLIGQACVDVILLFAYSCHDSTATAGRDRPAPSTTGSRSPPPRQAEPKDSLQDCGSRTPSPEPDAGAPSPESPRQGERRSPALNDRWRDLVSYIVPSLVSSMIYLFSAPPTFEIGETISRLLACLAELTSIFPTEILFSNRNLSDMVLAALESLLSPGGAGATAHRPASPTGSSFSSGAGSASVPNSPTSMGLIGSLGRANARSPAEAGRGRGSAGSAASATAKHALGPGAAMSPEILKEAARELLIHLLHNSLSFPGWNGPSRIDCNVTESDDLKLRPKGSSAESARYVVFNQTTILSFTELSVQKESVDVRLIARNMTGRYVWDLRLLYTEDPAGTFTREQQSRSAHGQHVPLTNAAKVFLEAMTLPVGDDAGPPVPGLPSAESADLPVPIDTEQSPSLLQRRRSATHRSVGSLDASTQLQQLSVYVRSPSEAPHQHPDASAASVDLLDSLLNFIGENFPPGTDGPVWSEDWPRSTEPTSLASTEAVRRLRLSSSGGLYVAEPEGSSTPGLASTVATPVQGGPPTSGLSAPMGPAQAPPRSASNLDLPVVAMVGGRSANPSGAAAEPAIPLPTGLGPGHSDALALAALMEQHHLDLHISSLYSEASSLQVADLEPVTPPAMATAGGPGRFRFQPAQEPVRDRASPLPNQLCRLFFASFGLLSFDSRLPTFELLKRDVPKLVRDIGALDRQRERHHLKAALVYVAPGQETEYDVLGNRVASRAFDEFAATLGWPVHLAFHTGYSAGLDTSGYNGWWTAYFATARAELVWHVSTWIPTDAQADLQRDLHSGSGPGAGDGGGGGTDDEEEDPSDQAHIVPPIDCPPPTSMAHAFWPAAAPPVPGGPPSPPSAAALAAAAAAAAATAAATATAGASAASSAPSEPLRPPPVLVIGDGALIPPGAVTGTLSAPLADGPGHFVPAREQLRKKRHIGNDVVQVFWHEHYRPYIPNSVVRSSFGDVQIVICPLPNGLRSIEVHTRAGGVADDLGPLIATPLVHRAIVSARCVGPLVRAAVLETTRRTQAAGWTNTASAADRLPTPYANRLRLIGEIRQRYRVTTLSFEQLMQGLVSPALF
ncbi:hypothetical protein H696_00689 [Fonticula alba]|uniref:Rap-GAP domain-containing protein n=1 Tax=Fonticula alba TaxID=691883 RepID=A0A058ZGT0_FONAL|nr:hypothetical protein H696_00689 [Fonticula alba]KCV73143.1 hypothetical protein H696_00689 [Fonticula alba]|eukprot:XP_009492844.1 hypothetical protein H696_00689 [Fonticula alba]